MTRDQRLAVSQCLNAQDRYRLGGRFGGCPLLPCGHRERGHGEKNRESDAPHVASLSRRPTPERAEVGVKYELRFADGSDAGTFETNVYDWNVGDEFIGNAKRRYRITAIIPVAHTDEFIENDDDDDMTDAWEVELVEGNATHWGLIDPDP
jgi:hypothetical protein